jgi:putative DNA primase/helicase
LFCANCRNSDAIHEAVACATGQEKPRDRDADPNDAALREQKQARALALWRGSEPAQNTLVDVYLTARGLPGLAASPSLRFRGDCHHPEGGRLPAMVALVVNVAGAAVAVHRTYLRRDGGAKAAVEPSKASLGPVWGGAIRLDAVAPEMVVAEGIETAASAGCLLGLPAWVAISAGNLRSGVMLPAEVKSVVIAADADEPGERAACDAASRWQREGRRVRIARLNLAGQDFNDLLCSRVSVASHA